MITYVDDDVLQGRDRARESLGACLQIQAFKEPRNRRAPDFSVIQCQGQTSQLDADEVGEYTILSCGVSIVPCIVSSNI